MKSGWRAPGRLPGLDFEESKGAFGPEALGPLEKSGRPAAGRLGPDRRFDGSKEGFEPGAPGLFEGPPFEGLKEPPGFLVNGFLPPDERLGEWDGLDESVM